MTFALLTLTLLVLLGIPAALCLDPHLHGPALLGLGFLLGAGIMPLLLLTLSLLGIPWSVPGVAVSGALLTALLLFVWRQGNSSRRRGRHWDVPAAGRDAFVAGILDAFTAVALLGHGIYASLARPGRWDFWSIWSFKGEAFWFRSGVDWSFLKDNANLYAVSAHLRDPIVFWKALASHWWQPFLWFCIAATLFFCRREIARRERFLITAVVIQMAFRERGPEEPVSRAVAGVSMRRKGAESGGRSCCRRLGTGERSHARNSSSRCLLALRPASCTRPLDEVISMTPVKRIHKTGIRRLGGKASGFRHVRAGGAVTAPDRKRIAGAA